MTALLHTGPAGETRARSAFTEGARDITPMVLGVVPFGMAIGATAGTLQIDTGPALAGAPLILAGAAQLTTLQMLDAGVAPVVIVLSALMINARLLLYSASIAPWFRHETLRRRLVLAAPVIDQLHFTCVPRFERGDLDREGRLAYYSGAAIWLVGAWLTSQTSAMLVGASVPDAVGLRVAAPLALVGLLAKSMTDHRGVVAAIVAGVVAVVGTGIPFHSAVLVAALVGIAAGTLAARHTARSDATITPTGGNAEVAS